MAQDGKDLTAAERSYRARMLPVATGLVAALRSPEDPRSSEQMIDAVLEALRPLDQRIKHANSYDRFRPIG